MQLHTLIFCLLALVTCAQPKSQSSKNLILGCEQTSLYLPDLQGKTIALAVNHTTIFQNKTHLVDSLLSLGINIKTIFAPEHGFRGTADAGEHIKDGIDAKTGLPVVSLYGANRKPSPEQLKGIDVVIFDIQDVGVRYYTYPSTMHLVMEACAENNKKCIVIDRPNPNGHLIDGPVLDTKFASFVGMNPIPVSHGLTMGELALMINGEGWLKNKVKCNLSVIPCRNYNHNMVYNLPVAPSPNLPNLQSIYLYPSICLFEPTEISVGRGTDSQFQVIGGPNASYGSFTFTPVDKPGAQNPPNKGKLCYGLDLRKVDAHKDGFMLSYLIDLYQKSPNKDKFFTSTSFFDKLAGTDSIRKMLADGKTEAEMRQTWQADLTNYKKIRMKYLLYP